MPRRKFIDKKTATTFALVHRAGNDPLTHDSDASPYVFAERSTHQPKSLRRATESDYAYSSAGSVVSGSASSYRSSKVKQRGDLEDEFGLNVRTNEGEAAEHGVFFDDSEYDYMQHMRDLGGEVGGSVMWVEANANRNVKDGKKKQRLEDALRQMNVQDEVKSVGTTDTSASKARSLLPEEVLPSEFVRRTNYQDQQDVPDDIAGFQPDMDPRLREVLEALDDEAYVDDEDDEGMFGALVEDGYEVDKDEFELEGERMMFEDGEGELEFDDDEAAAAAGREEDDGWESDSTVRASSQPPPPAPIQDSQPPPSDAQAPPPSDPTGGAWLDEYAKFKSSSKTLPNTSTPTPAAPPSSIPTNTNSQHTSAQRRRRRKNAATSTTNYSMTSSTLSRTEHQRLLDSQFDRLVDNTYTVDEDEGNDVDETSSALSVPNSRLSTTSSKLSTASSLASASGPKSMRADFDNIIDSFLSTETGKKGGRRKGGAAGGQGMRQLDEVRSGLGPARVKTGTRGP